MGTMSSRAGTVTVRPSSFIMAVCGITDVCPNLPPQQPADHQVQIRGEIGLACVRGRSVCAHHKKATARKQLKVPAHELTKAPLDGVPGHRGTFPGRLAGKGPGRAEPPGTLPPGPADPKPGGARRAGTPPRGAPGPGPE